ncbi:MAG: hypothetical protein J5I90_06405 [Caldilineales bacterium]|nr:hypothetical protein [Caldilineales bacterium]
MNAHNLTCFYCERPFPLSPGAYRVIGIDVGPRPPVNLYACADCWREHPFMLSRDAGEPTASTVSTEPIASTVSTEGKAQPAAVWSVGDFEQLTLPLWAST